MPLQDTDERAVLTLAEAMVSSRALHVAADMGLADLFDDGPTELAALAERAQANPRALRAVLRLLAAHGLVVEEPETVFTLARRGQLLRTDHPQSVAAMVRLISYSFATMAHAEHSVRTGEDTFEHLQGETLFQHCVKNQSMWELFDRAMGELNRSHGSAILENYDFSRYRRIVDVAGGTGGFLGSVLAKFTDVTAVLVEQQHVLSQVREVLAEHGVADRCELVAGDFFNSDLPGDGDLYMLKLVIHDWADEHAVSILRNCRRAMPPDARLVLFERLSEPGSQLTPTMTYALLLLVMHGGQERTRAEYDELLAAAGLRLDRVVPAGADFVAIEAVPV